MGISKLFDYDCYLFDCDGVILDSNKIKTDVFYDVAVKYGTHDQATFLREYHIQNGGVSRFHKFKYFFEEIIKAENYEESFKQALIDFQAMSLEKCKTCNLVLGIEAFLKQINDSAKKFVVSGGLEEDLNKIFGFRKLDQFFDTIYGSPKTKFEIVDLIKPQGKVLFIGDSKLDYEVSMHYGYDFLFISGVSEWKNAEEVLESKQVIIAENFQSLKN